MGSAGRLLFLLVVVSALAAPPAWAKGELVDSCGPGAPLIDDDHDTPLAPWLDVCGGDVGGVPGDAELRAVTFTLHLAGEMTAAGGVNYWASFTTARCVVSVTLTVDTAAARPGPGHFNSQCDYRDEPCPHPQSEVENIHCGRADNRYLSYTPAVTGSVSGSTATVIFDPNALPPDVAPPGLVADLAPRVDGAGAVSYLPLEQAWAQTGEHIGAGKLLSNSLGPGGDWVEPSTEPVSLD